MDWFRVESDMVRHPRVLQLVHRLHMSLSQVVGHLVLFWSSVAEHAEDGSLESCHDSVIERWSGWANKKTGVWARALRDVGLIESDPPVVHGWKKRHEYMLRERDRKAEAARAARGSRGSSALVARATRGSSADVARLPYRTVPDGDVAIATSVGASAPTSDPAPPFALSSEAPPKPAADLPADLLRRWNALALELHLPRAEKLTPKRREAARLRIGEGLLDRWDEFAAALRGSRFHVGQNDLCWRADVVWLLRPEKWLALIERASAPPAPPSGNGSGPRRPLSRAERNKAEMDSVDWDAINREREALGLDNPTTEAHQANGNGPGSAPSGAQGPRGHTRDPP